MQADTQPEVMKMKLFQVFVLLFLSTLSLPSRADILVVQDQGNTPVPVEENDISMDYESVSIDASGDYQVDAVFHMRSHSKTTVKRTMAFPVTSHNYADYMERSFKVATKAAGEPDSAYKNVPIRLEMKERKHSWEDEFYGSPETEQLKYPGYVCWQFDWAPLETRIVRISYNMGYPESFRGMLDGWRVNYVVRTGALWKGPIKRADFQIRFPSDVTSYQSETSRVVVSHPKQATWVSNREVKWHFENWEPRKDIQVARYAWVGPTEQNIDQFFLRLPHPYQGNSRVYTDAWLDELVQKKMALWNKVFPEQCKKLDRALIKRLVAEWLHQEIFARHGDPFLLGKHDGQSKWPKEAVMAMDGYLYNHWSAKFKAYMYHGGWYKPNWGPDGSVSLRDLGKRERQNVRFLKNKMDS